MTERGVAGPLSDGELVRRFHAGDREAFGALVERHRDRVYRVCLRVTGDAEEALDASQEAFLSALRNLDRFRGDAAFTTWIHRIAVNASYDRMRARARTPLLHAVADDGSRPEPGPPVPDPADAVADATDVAAALASVPEEFRAALVLADVEDLPYDEISAILEVPVGTVKSRVHRGRVALARAMGSAPATPPGAEPTSPRPAGEPGAGADTSKDDR
ncbi:MAG TPA: sigma-70 family RNA polymerase sigma factor [Actinomycetota bacterium]|nr:sigma-70 family RNA polymerase sigma factor [Actinomycetota bacterium]